jgi:glycosyltransferase involved in cell wall biosynthesis
MKPTVSVVIPTYNNSALLAEAIDSVRSQDFASVEILIVDDGSADDTSEFLRSLQDSNIRVVRQPNGGPAKARNLGIAMSQGQWIAFLDDDDLWLPTKLKIQMEEIQRNPTVGFSYTDVILHYQNGQEEVHVPKHNGADIFNGLLWGNQLATDTVIVRRECVEAVGGFNESFRTGEDWDLWLKLAARFESIYVPKHLTFCRPPANRGAKYDMRVYESCTISVLDQLFTNEEIISAHPNIPMLRKRLYAFHYSVLAKSYLRQHSVADWWRLAQLSVRSHYSGWRYLMPSFLMNGR